MRSHRLWMRERKPKLPNGNVNCIGKSKICSNESSHSQAPMHVPKLPIQLSNECREREAELALRESRLDEWEQRVTLQSEALHVAEERFADEQRRATDRLRGERQQLQFLQEQQFQTHRRLLASIERHRQSLEEKELRLSNQVPGAGEKTPHSGAGNLAKRRGEDSQTIKLQQQAEATLKSVELLAWSIAKNYSRNNLLNSTASVNCWKRNRWCLGRAKQGST